MTHFDTLVGGKILLRRNFEKTPVLGQNCDALAYFCLGFVPFSFYFGVRIVTLLHIFVLDRLDIQR